ncbi:MAG: CcdB family protein [Magnetococcales bacterium]|nr:CcdB family protein [Magnetococcales bacterium]MBF0423892.1 CcdB family protein [Magnetococcales bacterium]
MAQFDLYPYDKSGSRVAWLVDVQSNLMDTLQTRIVIPLYPMDSRHKLIRGLNPTVDLFGGMFFLSTPEMAAVHVRELKQPTGSLFEMRNQIMAAMDLLFTGI